MSLIYWIAGLFPPALGWEHKPLILQHQCLCLIVLASIIGYWPGEFSNSPVLAKLKLVTQGKHLWVRTLCSTIVGEGVGHNALSSQLLS